MLEIKKNLEILRIIHDAPNSGHKKIIIHDSSKHIKTLQTLQTQIVSNKNKLCRAKWRFSIMNHPFWGTTIFGNTQIGVSPKKCPQPGSSPSKNKWNLVGLYHYLLDGHAAPPKPAKDVVLEKPNLEGPWFSLNKTFRNKNVQYIKLPNKIISMLWNIADKQQRMRPSSSKGRQSSKPRQKKQHHLFVEFLGIPDTDSVPEKGKTVEIFQHEIFPPFFWKNVGERRFLLIACCQICHILFSMLIWVTCGVAALPSFGWAEKTKIHIIHFTRGSRFERLFMCA